MIKISSVICSQLARRTRTQQAEDRRPLPLSGRRGKLQLQVPVSVPLFTSRAALCRRQEGKKWRRESLSVIYCTCVVNHSAAIWNKEEGGKGKEKKTKKKTGADWYKYQAKNLNNLSLCVSKFDISYSSVLLSPTYTVLLPEILTRTPNVD